MLVFLEARVEEKMLVSQPQSLVQDSKIVEEEAEKEKSGLDFHHHSPELQRA